MPPEDDAEVRGETECFGYPKRVRYFVIADDGQKYGPADVPTLNSWIADNRLVPNQMLEEEASGMRVVASSVQGLVWPSAPNPGMPGAGAGTYGTVYNRPGGPVGDAGKSEMNKAWMLAICSVVFSLCCCCVSIPCGVFALKTCKQIEDMGGDAKGPRVTAIVGFVITGILLIVNLATLPTRMQAIQQMQTR